MYNGFRNNMKTLTIISISAAFILASCGSSRYAAYGEYDDVYYNPAAQSQPQYVASQPAFTPESAMAAQPQQYDTSFTKGLSDYETKNDKTE